MCLFLSWMDLFLFFIFSFFSLSRSAQRTSREFSYVRWRRSVCRVGSNLPPDPGTHIVSRIGLASVCVFDSSGGGALNFQAVCSSLSSSLCCWKSWNRLCTPLWVEGTPEHFTCEVDRRNYETHRNHKSFIFKYWKPCCRRLHVSGPQFSMSYAVLWPVEAQREVFDSCTRAHVQSRREQSHPVEVILGVVRRIFVMDIIPVGLHHRIFEIFHCFEQTQNEDTPEGNDRNTASSYCVFHSSISDL